MENKLIIYESRLNQLSDLKKECMQLSYEYAREFSDEINEIFSLKVDAIILKKKIAYCVKKENQGQDIFQDLLNKSVNKEVREYRHELKMMIERKKTLDLIKTRTFSFDEKKKIKKCFYQIVHLIHPDLHPELSSDLAIQKLWQDAVDAYDSNDIQSLVLIYDRIILLIGEDCTYVLEGIDDKIKCLEKDIKEIKNENPYLYKYILEDEDKKIEMHKKSEANKKYYRKYIASLKNEFSRFNIIKRDKCDA